MSEKDEKAKANDEAGQGDKAAKAVTPSKEAPPPTTPPAIVEPKAKEPVAKPETKGGEGEKASEKLEQQLSTVQGMLKQTQSELSELRKEKTNFEGLRLQVESQTEALNLITDVLGEMASENEDLQQRVKTAKQAREADQKKAKAYGEIMAIAEKGGLSHDSPEMEPVKQAFVRGDYEGARTQTFLTVIGKVTGEGKIVKADDAKAPAEPPPPEKKKLPVVTSSPAPAADWRGMDSRGKISEGLRQARENQN